MKHELKIHNFYNFGYLSTKLPESLYKKLYKECSEARKNTKLKTGLSSTGVPEHFYIEKNKEELLEFIKFCHQTYEQNFPGVSDLKILTDDLPFKYGAPWVNLQKQHEFIPCHNHDGVLSYSIWMQIPYDSRGQKYAGNFNFVYQDILGRTRTEVINLSKKDEGTLLMFPSKLSHIVYPFYKNKKIRMAVSGNIRLNAKP